MDFDKILKPSILGRPPPTVLTMKSKEKPIRSKAKTVKKMDSIRLISERAARYDVVIVPANVASGLSFENLLQGDTVRAEKELQKIFGNSTVRRRKHFAKAVEHAFIRILKSCPWKVYKNDAHYLSDIRKFPDPISTSVGQ